MPTAGGGVAYPYLVTEAGVRVCATWAEIGGEGALVMLCRGRIHS